MHPLNRLGNFFLFVGLVLCALFLLSDLAHAINFWYLLLGGTGLIIGFLLKKQFPNPAPPPANRFRLIKELRNPAPKPPVEKKPFKLSLFKKKETPPTPAQSPAQPSKGTSQPPKTPPGKK